MKLQDVVNQLGEETKEASDNTTVADLGDSLRQSLDNASGLTKEAGEQTDVLSEVLKVAENLAGMDKEAELRHAEMMGAAFADAAISRFASYDAQVKVAEAQQMGQYPQYIEKTAEEEYVEGFQDGVEQVKLAAADEFAKGSYETRILINRMRNEA